VHVSGVTVVVAMVDVDVYGALCYVCLLLLHIISVNSGSGQLWDILLFICLR